MNLLNNNLIKLLEDLNTPFTIHETDGYFSGLISCNLKKELYYLEFKKYFDHQNLKSNHYEFLEQYTIDSAASFNTKSFSLSFDAEIDNTKKLIALGQW